MRTTIAGIDIIVDDAVGGDRRIQHRKPRSHRKRIVQKWRKNQRNWRTVWDPIMYRMGGMVICNRAAFSAIKAALEAQ